MTNQDPEENIKATIGNVSHSVHDEKEEPLKAAEQELIENYRDYVRDNPIRSVGIAVATGFLLSRLLSVCRTNHQTSCTRTS